MTSDPNSKPSWIGQSLPRVEDDSFLRGAGAYTADLKEAGALHACFVRSPHAHAALQSVDAQAARESPGVFAVMTYADLEPDLAGPIPSMNHTAPFDVRNRDGRLVTDASQPTLATGKVRYAGEPVAVVVANSPEAAAEAAELVAVDYRPLPPCMSFETATAPGAAPIWEESSGNASVDWSNGKEAEVAAIFDRAAKVVRCEVVNNRINPCFMEPRAAIASFDAARQRYLLQAGGQSAHGLKLGLAGILGVPPENLHVIVPDTGGGFGARNNVYPELAPLLLAARALGRPVRWVADRAESFLTDAQARDLVLAGELAFDAEGDILGLRVSARWRHGAYFISRNLWVMTAFMPPTIGGVYRIPVADIRIQGAFTNTTPQAAFRGIGRVESNYLLERLLNKAARELGEDPVTFRKRHLLRAEDLPYQAAGGARYTTGEFARNLERALALSEHASFERRRAASTAAGKLRGIGVVNFIENDGGAPSEFAEVEASADGMLTVFAGTQDFGMGHRTIYQQIAADQLGLAPADIEVVYGDTDKVETGAGSHGSRSARIGGSAVVTGSLDLIEKARELASALLEASPADIEYAAGLFTIRGTDRRLSLFEIAAEQAAGKLSAKAQFLTEAEAHSNGCLVCEVEVDPETGRVDIVRHTMVMDVGRAINPMIVEGQLHGGAAQGLGQAGLEGICYDEVSGQTLTGSFMDYNIPKADDLPFFTVELNEVAEPDNPLGVKGAGESATSGSPAALVNAVLDALAPLGVEDIQMPLTPLAVWDAIERARQR